MGTSREILASQLGPRTPGIISPVRQERVAMSKRRLQNFLQELEESKNRL